MNIFKLSAVLLLSSESYKRGIAEAKNENKSFETSAKNTSKVAVTAFLAIAAAIMKVVQAIGKLIVDTAEFGAEIKKNALAAGLAVEEYQEWSFVMQQVSGDASVLTSVMKNLSTAAENNDSDLRKLIGTVKDGNGQLKSQSQLFREALAAIQAIENPTERAAMANKVFGKSYQQLGDILNMTTAEIDAMMGEAHKLGVVLSEETINAADEFETKMKNLTTLRKAAFAELIFGDPAEGERLLNEYVEKIKEMMPKFIDAGAQIAGAILEGLIKIFWPGILGAVAGAVSFASFGLPPQIGAFLGFLLGTGAQHLFNKVFGGVGQSISSESGGSSLTGSSSSISNAYSSATTSTQNSYAEIVIKAEGDTPVSQKTADTVAETILKQVIEQMGVSMSG